VSRDTVASVWSLAHQRPRRIVRPSPVVSGVANVAGGQDGFEGVAHSGGSVCSPTDPRSGRAIPPKSSGPTIVVTPRVFRSSTPPTIAGSIGSPSLRPDL